MSVPALLREPCPYCHRQWGHSRDCAMFGMSEYVSSLLYGYPVCLCCGLRYGPERTERHGSRRGGSLLDTARLA